MEQTSYDVIVLGGGAAGVFAAVSAAKAGAETLLVEKNGVLGGTITAAGVNFPGLFFAWGKQIIHGPCWDAILRTVELGGAVLPKIQYQPEHHYDEQISLNPFTYSYVLDEAVRQAGVSLLLHTMLAGMEECEDGLLVSLTKREGACTVKAAAVVDATGDAAAVGMMGYERVKSSAVQPATLIHNLSGYRYEELNLAQAEAMIQGFIAAGRLSREEFQGNHLISSLKARRIYMHVSEQDAETSEGKTRLELNARRRLMRIVQCFREIPGLEKLTVSDCAPECGVRETYRIVGEKTITAERYIEGYVYDDAVCYCFYPIDRHIPEGIHQVFLQPGVIPTIPYGALVPKGSKRVLAAGRCISGDADASSAYRVQAPCMASGQAAGVAAAIAARDRAAVGDVPYHKLKNMLTRIGAIVPDSPAGR